MLRHMLACAAALALASGALGCSSDSTGPEGPTGPAGGPVKGQQDDHCDATPPVVTKMSVCQEPGDPPDPGDYGAPLYNSSGYDDDCKYKVSWTSTPIYENYDVMFTLTAVDNADGKPATGSESYAEVFLNDLHPEPNTGTEPTAVETPAGSGKYVIGPHQFDAPGKWTVRFHLFEQCTDTDEQSPHGHAAFYVDVP